MDRNFVKQMLHEIKIHNTTAKATMKYGSEV